MKWDEQTRRSLQNVLCQLPEGFFRICCLETIIKCTKPEVQKVKAVTLKRLWCFTHLIHHSRVNYNENQWCLLSTIEPDLIMGSVVLYCHCCQSRDKTPVLICPNSAAHVTHLWPVFFSMCFFFFSLFLPYFRDVEARVFFVPIAWPQRPLSGERMQMVDMYAMRVASTRSFTR